MHKCKQELCEQTWVTTLLIHRENLLSFFERLSLRIWEKWHSPVFNEWQAYHKTQSGLKFSSVTECFAETWIRSLNMSAPRMFNLCIHSTLSHLRIWTKSWPVGHKTKEPIIDKGFKIKKALVQQNCLQGFTFSQSRGEKDTY